MLASVGVMAAAFMPVVMTTGHAQAQVSIHHLTKMQQRLISAELINAAGPPPPGSAPTNDSGGGPDGAPEATPSGFTASGLPGHPANYFPNGLGTCSTNIANNIKVNQNCLNVSDANLQGRSQANNETSIAQDPIHPNNLVASNNDYVRGDGTCGAAYSTTRGASWNNSTVPDVFTRGTPVGKPRQYWQAGGDTSVAWDTKGNAYLSCQLFNRGAATSTNTDFSSAFVVFRSTGNNGASWNFPGRYVFANFDPTGVGTVIEDKQLIAIDNKVGSPYQDRIYVTWTDFAADGSAYIYEAYSKDYGESFSPRVVVSSASSACTNNFGAGTPNGPCNVNQFSQPFTGPDGSLYVTYVNYNNQPISGTDNHNQVMLVKSTDGGNSFSAPVKLSDLYDLPDCDSYQGAGADSGRACVPEKGATANSVFRAANYPSGAVNPTNPSQVIVTFASYINADSQETNGCVPAFFAGNGNPTYTGVKTVGACNNKILIKTSNDGGATFGGGTDPRTATVVPQAPGQARTDQWFQWASFANNGQLAVSYYDRQYGNNEITGYSDFSISGSRDMVTFGQSRVTSSSMPPPTQFPNANGAGLFWGDYTGLTATTGIAYPIWSDTRNTDVFLCPGTATPGTPPALCSATENNGIVANDEEMYTALVGIPIR
jgi:hypothetical protein